MADAGSCSVLSSVPTATLSSPEVLNDEMLRSLNQRRFIVSIATFVCCAAVHEAWCAVCAVCAV